MARSYFDGLTNALSAQQTVVLTRQTEREIARASINLQKERLLGRLNQFNTMFDANYRRTEFYDSRPYAPSITDGQETFSRAILKVVSVWEELNEGPAPSGVVLPIVLPATPDLPGTMAVGELASAISTLQFAYRTELKKGTRVDIARSKRNLIQEDLYEILLAYRENVPGKMSAFPELVDTMPRLTPLPGHTPEPVNASAVFEAPDKSKVVHDASTDPLLQHYQLRGCIGPDWNEDDAVVVATHSPNEPREFITTFGLNQPGVQVVFKLYVMLTTGNEAGSAPMVVQRPFSAVA